MLKLSDFVMKIFERFDNGILNLFRISIFDIRISLNRFSVQGNGPSRINSGDFRPLNTQSRHQALLPVDEGINPFLDSSA
jgi:hypothetical protein